MVPESCFGGSRSLAIGNILAVAKIIFNLLVADRVFSVSARRTCRILGKHRTCLLAFPLQSDAFWSSFSFPSHHVADEPARDIGNMLLKFPNRFTVGTKSIADPENCFQELISENLLFLLRNSPSLGRIIVS